MKTMQEIDDKLKEIEDSIKNQVKRVRIGQLIGLAIIIILVLAAVALGM